MTATVPSLPPHNDPLFDESDRLYAIIAELREALKDIELRAQEGQNGNGTFTGIRFVARAALAASKKVT